MNAEKRFEKWWESLPSTVYNPTTQTVPPGCKRIVHGLVLPKQSAKPIWLACEATKDAEIERVAKEIESQPGKSTGAEIAALLRSLLPAQPKEGE